MRNKIVISKPYIQECESEIFGDAVRLCANITMLDPNTHIEKTKECYFEFDENYKKYLCPERSDAFVMGLLSSAMELDMDIEFEAPISERLYYQLTTYYIPMVAKYNSSYPMNNIRLFGSYDDRQIKNEKAVATGCSGGVDTFYTIAKHLSKDIPESNKITHIVYSSSGTSDFNKERVKNEYKKNITSILNIAKDCNLEAICCFNNLFEFYKIPYRAFNMFYSTTFGSVAYALQKLIHIYYVSSGDPISNFSLNLNKTNGHDSSVFDVFTTQCMNSENLTFYSAGMEYSRIEKEKYIADFIPAQKNLKVCAEIAFMDNNNVKYNNCSICSKCLRTMVQFYSFNKLNNFKDVFDVEEFYKHKAKYVGKMIGLNKKSYVKDMKKIAKANNVKISFGSYIYAYLWYRPIKFLRHIFRNSILARKLYYKLNLDYKLDGYRGPAYEAYQENFKNKK